MNLGNAIAYIDLDASKFVNGMKQVSANMKTFESETSSTSQKMTAMGSTFKSVGGGMTAALTVPLAGIATASTMAGANFEKSMS